MQHSLLTNAILLALTTLISTPAPDIPEWLEGLWDRDDIYIMSPDHDGMANDGLSVSESWPQIVAYPRQARASASYPAPNGTKAYPNGVGVIVFLPGDYSARKMHPSRQTEYWPHWDNAPSEALAPDSESPLILVYCESESDYSSLEVHPTSRAGSLAEFGSIRFSGLNYVYCHGLTSNAAFSGLDFSSCQNCKFDFGTVASPTTAGFQMRFGSQSNTISRTLAERPYPWSVGNDFPAVHLKDRNIATFTASSSSGLLITHGLDLPTGTTCTFTSTNTLPTGLSAGTPYWLIRVSSTTSRVATSLANAQSATAIAYTDAGTGTHRVRIPNANNVIEDCTLINYADAVQLAGDDAKIYRQDDLQINITAPGTGYTVGDALVFGTGTTTAVYRHASATVATVDGGGGITSVTVSDKGAYQGGFPSVTIVGTGSGATFTCTDLAGPGDGNDIFYGQDFAINDVYEQGWPENDDYGACEGTIIRRCWMGMTDDRKIAGVYDTYFGIENCIDIKAGGRSGNPVQIYENKMFGLRANGTSDSNGSPTACFTFHDTTSYVNITDNDIFDMSSAFNMNTQYYRDRRSDDTPTPAWESYSTVVVDNNRFADIDNYATTAYHASQQGHVLYSGNSMTFTNNTLAFCPNWAAEARNVLADPFTFGGNIAHTPFTTAPGDWTDGTVSSGYVEASTTYDVPYTSHQVTIRSMVPA